MAPRLSPEDYRLLDDLIETVELPAFRMADLGVASKNSLTPGLPPRGR